MTFEKFKGQKPTPIKLADLSSPFFFLGFGVGLSIVVHLFEIIFFSWKKKRKNQISLAKSSPSKLKSVNYSVVPIITVSLALLPVQQPSNIAKPTIPPNNTQAIKNTDVVATDLD